jgi:predicted nucleotidyltransferase
VNHDVVSFQSKEREMLGCIPAELRQVGDSGTSGRAGTTEKTAKWAAVAFDRQSPCLVLRFARMVRQVTSHRRPENVTAKPLSLDEARQDILAISRAHGASRVRVFGSFARGRPRSDSDIDLLVDMEKGRTLLDLIALERTLRARLGRPVDVLTERSLSPHLRRRILSEARPV